MMGKRRKSLLAVLVCVFALVLSLGIMCACNDNSANTQTDAPAASTQWYYGTEVPAESLGSTGDHYLNTESLTSYVKSADGWTPTALYSGTEDPDKANGEVGDLYLNTQTGVLSQKDSNGLWKVVLTVKGEKGRDGVMWFSGNGDPKNVTDGSLKDARKGDFYIDTNGFSVYQLGANGWGDPLGELKGDPGKDSVHFFDGEGAPQGKEGTLEGLQVGDLYLGTFKGIEDDKGAGSRLYKYEGAEKGWTVLMDTVRTEDINIHSLADLETLTANIAKYNGYAGKVVHLKSDLFFGTETVKGRRAAQNAADWTPIGTSETPFRGTFDGEDHIIHDFSTAVSTDATKVGFFGNVEGAIIQNLHFENVTVDATAADTPKEAVGAVVVGQAQGETTVKNVTVTNATVQMAEGTTEENAPAVGGLVGKVDESAGEPSLKVEGSSFEGTVEGAAEGTTQSVDSLVAVPDENVTVTDSTVTDTQTNATVGWDGDGSHYAEQKTEEGEPSRSYFVSSAQDITDLLSKADGSVNVTLESDLVLAGTDEESFALDLAGKDLVLDLSGKNLTLNTEAKNAQFTVSGGSKLTVTNSGDSGVLNMGRVENKPVISVQGSGSELTIENVTVEVNNTYDCNNARDSYKIAPAVVAENGSTVNIGSGTTITAHGQGNTMSYKEPQIAAADGDGSIVKVDGEDIVINLDNATGLYAQNDGKIDFRNGTINMTGGSCNVALGLGEGAGNIVFSGGTINITGNLEGTQVNGLNDFVIAIGSTTFEADEGLIVVNGGTINLKNTGGSAIGVGGVGYYGVTAYVGDGATINGQATENGKAYALASEQIGNGFVGTLYADAIINIEESTNNFKLPKSAIGQGYFGDSGWLLYDGSSYFNAKKMSEDRTGSQYTKEAMDLVPHN